MKLTLRFLKQVIIIIMNNLGIVFILALLLTPAPGKKNIYQWRGYNRTGVYYESNLLKVWPADGPKEIWSINNIGNGFVSPVFTENNFYITGEIESKVILFCFNLKGEKQWETSLGPEWVKSYQGARCAPTIVDDLIYVGTGMGNLFCIDSKNGKIIWSKDLIIDFDGVLPLHGYSEAALIDDDKVFWTPGGKVHNVVALNRFTGKLIWSNKGFGEASAYNPPKLISLPTRNIIATFSSYHLMGFDSKNGQLLWSQEQDNFPPDKRGPGYGDTHSNTIIYEDGAIYYSEGDGNCGVKLDLSSDGTKITEVWRNKGFDSFMGGVIKNGNFLYTGAVARPQLVSIDATTGILSDSLRLGTGALISADGMLYYYNQKGEMMLLNFDQGKMNLISTFRIKKGTAEHFSHPVINKSVLYQRHGTVLMAFDIRNN
jgi:outer membrane protein assembly factor BamB